MNSITLKGNLGGTPELRSVGAKNTSVANFSVAHSEYKGKDADGKAKYETFWVKVVVWGRLAELVANNLAKGDSVIVVGKLTIRSYEKDGATKYSTEIVANEISKAQKMSGGGSSTAESLFDNDGFSNQEFPES